MQFNKDYEREISLRDLFFHVLYKWRSILAAALIGAILLSGYAFLKGRGESDEMLPEEIEAEERAYTALENYEASIALYQKLLNENNAYREQSILMKVNPYQVWRSTAVYSVIVEEAPNTATLVSYDPAAHIASVYPTLILYNLDQDRLKDIYKEIDLHYITEVVSASTVSSSGSFRINTFGLTEEMAKEGLAFFEEVIMNASGGDVQQMGKHRIVKVTQHTRQIVSSDIEDKQVTVAKNLKSYQDSIKTLTNSIAKLPLPDGKVGGRTLVIFVIIGIILGAFVAVGIHIAIYVFGGKVRTGREITEQFEVPVFGEFKHSRARRPGKGIDKTIEKMEFRKDRTEEVTILDNICALIREQESGSRILLTGTIPESRMQELAGKLKGTLGDDVPLQIESSFLNNSRAITEAGKATAVIVAEEKHVSESEDVRRMMEVLSLSKTPVIGTILV